MGFILLSLFSALFASEVVELEPVLDLYSSFNCGAFNDTSRGSCQALPYCVYVGSKCYVDPCLKWVADNSETVDCGQAPSVTSGTVDCEIANYGSYIEDCTTTTTKSHKYCQYQAKASPPAMDECTYEYLKSGKSTCPAYKCQNGTQSGSNSNYCTGVSSSCVGSTSCGCLTKTYCSLNPGCYVVGDFCVEDKCTQYYDGQANQACGERNDVHTAGSPEGAYTNACTAFEVYNGSASGGTTMQLCVNSVKNKAPNKCFQLGSPSNAQGNGKTSNCLAYTLPKCTTDLECNAQFSGSGPYGAYYCGDATHSSFSILMHAPSLLLVLLVVLFAF